MRKAIPLLVAVLLPLLVWAHGATRGLHMHLTPDPVAPGETITIELSATEKISSATASCDEYPPVTAAPDSPAKRLEIEWTVPAELEDTVLTCRAEATTVAGRSKRASALLRVEE